MRHGRRSLRVALYGSERPVCYEVEDHCLVRRDAV